MTEISSEKRELHPIGTLLPQPDGPTLKRIRKEVYRAGGVDERHPILIFEGKIIERWPEYCACTEFNLPCSVKEYEGNADSLIEYLLSRNTFQLGKPHRALIGAYLKKSYREPARANQSAGGIGETFVPKYHARDAAAEKMKISPRMITDAESIIDSGSDLLQSLVLDESFSIGVAAALARLDKEKLENFLARLVDNLAQFSYITNASNEGEDKLEADYEKELREIKKSYKEKRQVSRVEMKRRMGFADTPEEKDELKQEQSDARKHFAEFQKNRIENLNLNYQKKRAVLLAQNKKNLSLQLKNHLRELAAEALDEPRQCLVYIRWDYELGQVKLEAAWGVIQSYDDQSGIYTLISGRKVMDQTEKIALLHTATIAEDLCTSINGKRFCAGQPLFRPDSHIAKIFSVIGQKFLEQIQTLLPPQSE